MGEGSELLLLESKIDPKTRPDQLPIEKWCELAINFDKWNNSKNKNKINLRNELLTKEVKRELLSQEEIESNPRRSRVEKIY